MHLIIVFGHRRWPKLLFDLHCHSVSSDDSRATVEQFLKWIGALRKKGREIDGIVLTEHRKFDIDADYTHLANKYDVQVLKGSELDTDCGHFLVFGVNKLLLNEVDFSDIKMSGVELARIAKDSGAIAIPAHPGRYGVGLVNYLDDGLDLSNITIVEALNGSARAGENEKSAEFMDQYGLAGTGGSDAHFVSGIAQCLTSFDNPIASETDLVEQLIQGQFKAISAPE
mgnify:CR=1 FL=1